MKVDDCVWYEAEFCNCGCKLETEEMEECICTESTDGSEGFESKIPDNSDGKNM